MFDADWSDYGLKRLFDQSSEEHLPPQDQLKLYMTRDLQKSKVFATANRIWGHSRIRRRVHIAPPMKDTGGRDVMGMILTSQPNQMDDESGLVHGDIPKKRSEDDMRSLHRKELDKKRAGYKDRLKSRMELREGLETMGLGERWLQGKPELTELEQRVLERISKKEHGKKTVQDNDDFVAARLVVTPRSPKPELVYELPEAIKIISRYLSQRRLRVVDLFTQADKDKSWTVTRQEFRKCIKEAKIPLSDTLLNELIDNLDADANEEINFREFLCGVKSYRLQERKKQSMSAGSQVSSFSITTASPKLPHSAPPAHPRLPSAISDTTRYSPSNMSDSSYLTVPPIDLTERREITPDEMIEKRKRERYSAKGRRRKKDVDKVRTGNRLVDSHSLKSTLGERNGGLVDTFREARLKDYYKLCKLCKERDIELTTELLEKALLYPGDKPRRRIKSKIRQPGLELLSSHFADPPAPADDVDDDLILEKVVYNSEGEPVMEFKHSLPRADDVRPPAQLQNLPTGKAFVRSKVNSWLTYEEYVRLTSHLKKRYVEVRSTENKPDPFWPGHLLDKLQLYMENYRPSPAESLYRANYAPKRVYSEHVIDSGSWLISDTGYVNNGNIEGRKCYSIDWK